MNTFGYFLHNLLRICGIRREKLRMRMAYEEFLLLKEAEEILGKSVWRKVGEIDALTKEYWSIKDLVNQQCEFEGKLETIKGKEGLAVDSAEVKELSQKISELRRNRQHIMEQIRTMQREVATVQAEMDGVAQRIEGLHMKLKVLESERVEEGVLHDVKEELVRVEHSQRNRIEKFASQKEKLERLKREKEECEEKISKKSEALNKASSEDDLHFSHLSKNTAEIHAKIASLENAKKEHYEKIGSYISNSYRDPQLKKILKQQRSMISKMDHLRRSIEYNQRLARAYGKKVMS